MAGAQVTTIKQGVGAALRFVRERWRLVLIVAGAGALTHALVAALLGATLLAPIGMAVVSAAVYASLTRAALSGTGAAPATLLRDSLLTAASVAIVGLFLAIIAFAVAYGAMAVLIAPYMEEAQAAANDEAALRALMERAVAEQPHVLSWALAALAVLAFLLTTRFYLAVPASLDQNRVLAFDSWSRTKGRFLRIAGARLLLLAPALIFAGALQSLIGLATGIGADNALAMAGRAQANPLGFLLFYAGAQFLQIAIYTALEAGLSSALYRTTVTEESAA